MTIRRRSLSPCIAVLAAFALSGCAAFSGNTLPRGASYPAMSLDPKPSVSVQLTFRQFLNGSQVTLFRGTAEVGHTNRLVGMLEESGYFSSVVVGDGPADVTLALEFKNEGSANLGMAFLTGLTLFLVPSWATDNWRLDATATARASGRSQQFHVEEFVTQWQHVLLIPVMPFKLTPVVTYQVQNDVWRTFIAQLATSGLLQEAATH